MVTEEHHKIQQFPIQLPPRKTKLKGKKERDFSTWDS